MSNYKKSNIGGYRKGEKGRHIPRQTFLSFFAEYFPICSRIIHTVKKPPPPLIRRPKKVYSLEKKITYDKVYRNLLESSLFKVYFEPDPLLTIWTRYIMFTQEAAWPLPAMMRCLPIAYSHVDHK